MTGPIFFPESSYNYQWPGNVRELQNAVERALILSKGNPLIFDDLGGASKKMTEKPDLPDEDSLALNNLISRHIMRVLEMTGGRVGGPNRAAKLLQLNPSTFRQKKRKLRIPFGIRGRKFQEVKEKEKTRAKSKINPRTRIERREESNPDNPFYQFKQSL